MIISTRYYSVMEYQTPGFGRRVGQLLDRLARVTREAQFSDGLNPAQWEALRYLSRANRFSRSPSALAEYLGTTKGTASQTLIALEQKGFIGRTPDPRDRRGVRLELTDAGREAVARDPIIQLEKAADQLDEGCRTTVVRALSLLLHDLQMARGIRQFGVCRDCSMHCVDGHQAHPIGDNHCGATGEVIELGAETQICANFKEAAE